MIKSYLSVRVSAEILKGIRRVSYAVDAAVNHAHQSRCVAT